ncbi:MAG: RsiV family protein [Spirochaetaceae bacterium]|jgi:hypothetical protein|nr:RsiV family protein [Spirochaetaceae bacterium]
MNKQSIYKLLKIVSLSLLFVACKSEGPAPVSSGPQGLMPYQTISDKRAILLFPELKDGSPRMNFDLTLLDMDGPEPIRSLVLDVLYQGMSPGEYADSLIAFFGEQYNVEGNPHGPNPDDFSATWNWEYAETFKPLAQTPRITVLYQERDYYTGGAHGMYEKNYFVFALDEAKQLHPEDLFKAGTEPALRDLIMQALWDRQGLASGAPLSSAGFFDDSVDVPQDFFLGPGGIGFQWDVYEIAPYVMGPIEIVIPYKNISGLLSPRGLSLIKEF